MGWIILTAVIIIGVFIAGQQRSMLHRSKELRRLTLSETRRLAISADNREDFIRAIRDICLLVHPDRTGSPSGPQPPEDYLALWSEFHYVILPAIVKGQEALKRVRLLACVTAPLLAASAVALLLLADSEPALKAAGVAAVLFMGFLFLYALVKTGSDEEDERLEAYRVMDDGFRRFLKPEESSRLFAGKINPAGPPG